MKPLDAPLQPSTPPRGAGHRVRFRQSAVVSLVLLAIAVTVHAQDVPPAEPPADWGPMSINLEDVAYPHEVRLFDFRLDGQDLRMAYMDVAPANAPNGRTVVLLHGMNFFGEVWRSTIDVLRADGFRVVVPDQIGFGRSTKALLHYTISTHASNTRRLVEHLRIGRVSVIGHSMGGMVASRFASAYPEIVDDLVLMNPIGLEDQRAARPPRDLDEAYQASLKRDYREILAGMQRYYVTWRPEYLKYVRLHYGWTRSGDWPRLAMVRALQTQAIYADPVVYDWARIRARTLVIGGEQDGPNFPRLARHVADTIPNARLVLLPAVGHNPHFEAPDRLFPVVTEFLTRH